jgi:hypothetical protein
MNEFDLQGWEREIQAWRRRLETHDAPVVRAELNDIARDLVALRAHPESESAVRNHVEKRLVRLLALYDLSCRGRAEPRVPGLVADVAREDRRGARAEDRIIPSA